MKRKTIAVLLLLAPMIWVGLAQNNGAPTDDYVSPELRARVEKLKVEAGQATDDPAVLAERLATLWDWANAYSLTAGPIPGDFPQSVANANRALRGLPRGGARIPAGQIGDFLAQYTRELEIKDGSPNALGTLTLSSNGPFRAGEHIEITQTYTVGDTPMAVGGGTILGLGRSTRIQADDPAGPGYVTLRCSNPRASFTVAEPWGEWTSFMMRRTIPFRLSGEPLAKGDTVTITFGDRSGGGPGMEVQEWSNDSVTMATLLDFEGNGWTLTPQWPSFEVIGQEEIRYVNLIAPSIVEPGETFTLVVRSEDQFKNLASGKTGELELLVNDRPLRKIASGSPALLELGDVQLDQPGVYRFSVRSPDGALRGTSNAVRVERDPAHRVYWGETHGHTGFAEGQGSPDGYYKFGRDVARLDFLSLSEHDIWMDDFEWKTLQRMVEKYRIPGRFTTILGFEWTSRFPYGGHHNVFFRDSPGRRRVANQKAPLLNELYEGLRAENKTDDVLIIPHAHQPGDWHTNDPDMERLVEIQSGHGTFDWFGNKYLASGFRVGFVGASDNHVGHPGYSGMTNQQLGGLAAALAPENTSKAIFDALRDRATYATTGERILLDATLNGGRMGLPQKDTERRTIDCRVHGTAPIDGIDVIKNGAVVYTKRYLETGVADETWVQVRFESSTEVVGRRTVPRGGRPWRGVIRVEGAELTGYEDPWHQQPGTYRVSQEGGQLRYALETRGRGTALLLKLRGASADTRVIVEMAQTREQSGSGGDQRELQRLPAAEAAFRLGDLGGKVDRREFQVLEQTDALSLQLIPSGGALDQEFRYTDQDDPKPGDYYYVRVRQVDGAMAWSSPFWVGERPRSTP